MPRMTTFAKPLRAGDLTTEHIGSKIKVEHDDVAAQATITDIEHPDDDHVRVSVRFVGYTTVRDLELWEEVRLIVRAPWSPYDGGLPLDLPGWDDVEILD